MKKASAVWDRDIFPWRDESKCVRMHVWTPHTDTPQDTCRSLNTAFYLQTGDGSAINHLFSDKCLRFHASPWTSPREQEWLSETLENIFPPKSSKEVGQSKSWSGLTHVWAWLTNYFHTSTSACTKWKLPRVLSFKFIKLSAVQSETFIYSYVRYQKCHSSTMQMFAYKFWRLIKHHLVAEVVLKCKTSPR